MKRWEEIFGQAEALEALRSVYLADRLPHGLIFAGPRGVGKGTAAETLAKLFLCERPNGDIACGKCESCRAMEAATHPDFHLITRDLIRFHDKTGKSKGIDLSINVIRPELLEPAGRKAALGRGKVFLVEQAELMNPAAQNALLKTLEEPAGRTLIILLTDQLAALLPTVRSRCRTIRFAELDETLVRKELERRGVKEPAAVAALAHGSLGTALRWSEDGVIQPAQQLIAQLDAVLAGKSTDDLPGFFRKAADDYAARQLERDPLGSKDQASRAGLDIYLSIAAEHLRRRLAEATEPDRLESLCAMIEAVGQAESYLDANVNVAVALQQLSLTLETANRA
jgi:DNA polymerase-3 subunit delta'